MTIHDALMFGFKSLKKSGVDSYQLDSELLLSKVLFYPGKITERNFLNYVWTIERERLYALPQNHQITKTQQRTFSEFIQRRAKRVPVAYLTNLKYFYNLPFYVDERVLIPRPQTEMLVEKTLHEITKKRNHKNTTIIDIGTGSGCIIVSITKEVLRQAQNDRMEFIATDTSLSALNIAKQNARIHGVSDNIRFIKTDQLPQIKTDHLVIVANLPYLDPTLKPRLFKQTPELRYEPQNALFAPNHGLKFYQRLIQQIKRNQKKHVGMTCFLEIDPHQRNILSKQINQTLRRKNSYYDGVIEFRFP